MLFEEFTNTIVQLLVVLILCGALWLLFGRKRSTFGNWLGLYLPTRTSMIWAALLFIPVKALALIIYLVPSLSAAAGGENTVAGKIAAVGLNPEIIAVIFLVAIVKTSLTEEIFSEA